MLSNGLDGFKPAFSYAGIFLVCKLFLEGFDGSVELVVRDRSKTDVRASFRDRGKSPQIVRKLRQGRWKNSLCRGIVFFDGPVDECCDVASSSACLVRRLGDAQSAQKLIEDLDRLQILGFGVCRI